MDQSELKIGQIKTRTVAGKTITIKPLPLGKIKKAMQAFANDEGKPPFETITLYLLEVLNNGENEGVTREWIEDNITLPLASEIVEDVRAINGLRSFFQAGAATPKPAVEERPLSETTPTPGD